VWANSNPNRVAAAGGTGGTVADSAAYIVFDGAHNHAVQGSTGTGGPNETGSTGTAAPVTITPKHTLLRFGIYAGQAAPAVRGGP
jgi:hypothetical protein